MKEAPVATSNVIVRPEHKARAWDDNSRVRRRHYRHSDSNAMIYPLIWMSLMDNHHIHPENVTIESPDGSELGVVEEMADGDEIDPLFNENILSMTLLQVQSLVSQQ